MNFLENPDHTTSPLDQVEQTLDHAHSVVAETNSLVDRFPHDGDRRASVIDEIGLVFAALPDYAAEALEWLVLCEPLPPGPRRGRLVSAARAWAGEAGHAVGRVEGLARSVRDGPHDDHERAGADWLLLKVESAERELEGLRDSLLTQAP